ncbi:roadblock/LC7 domain-containing protein [candidate division WOR-3 bacterium]|uniref:Roadblock/LC7 domain-containing protein n=1 Tax=candidate division WOR-3 bacterium TaxID=2052148 RepID=A0A660SKM3_UNCW3|nr:MAG: roadblock/LC7 domain-containing protein [candidate division WOR-3 bacterium]
MSFNIFEKDFWSITEVLNNLIKSANVKAALLIDKAGQVITSSGDTEGFDVSSFATLSAADFAATSQLATIIGEKEFAHLYHQGEKENIYITLVGDRVILAVLFDKRTTLGMVRVKIKQTVTQLERIFDEIFTKIGTQPAPEQRITDEFTKEAEEELDKLFG